jgi:hypothetical protein
MGPVTFRGMTLETIQIPAQANPNQIKPRVAKPDTNSSLFKVNQGNIFQFMANKPETNRPKFRKIPLLGRA